MACNQRKSYKLHKNYGLYFTGEHIQITKDGGTLLAECKNSVEVINIENGDVEDSIVFVEDAVVNIALSPNNESLMVALRSSSLNHYEWPSKKFRRGFRSYHQATITALCWDSSSTLLASGAADGSVRVWDVNQNFCTHSFRSKRDIVGLLRFSRNLQKRPWLFVACCNVICIWKLEAGTAKELCKLQCHTAAVSGMAATLDERYLVSCGFDSTLILWNLQQKKAVKMIPVYEPLSGLILQPYGVKFPNAAKAAMNVLVIGDKGCPSLWCMKSGRELWRAQEPLVYSSEENAGASIYKQIFLSQQSGSVVFTTFDNSIVFARCDTLGVSKILTGCNREILDLLYVGEENTHLVAAISDPQLRIYDIRTMNCQLVRGHTGVVLALTRHQENPNIFASSAHDFSTRVWKLREDGGASCLAIAQGHTQSVGTVAFGYNFLVTGSKDACLKVWDVNIKLLQDDCQHPQSLVCRSTAKGHDKDINCVCVSKNCKLIASASQDKTAKIWSSDSLSLVATLEGHKRGIWCVEFSPVDQVLATSSADGSIRIWTLSNMAVALILEGHDASVQRVAWISQGLQMVSVAADGILKVWTVKGVCISTAEGHDSRVWALGVCDDGAQLATGGEDSCIKLWNDVTEEEIQKAAEETHRLAQDEQTLSNLIQKKNWKEALSFAIRLNKPLHGLRIVKELLDETEEALPIVLKRLSCEEIGILLHFATHWNSKTKHMRESQMILNNVLHIFTPHELEEISGWQKVLEGLLPYTEKHMRRLNALNQSSHILKFMVASMGTGLDESPLGLQGGKHSEKELLCSVQSSQSQPLEISLPFKTEASTISDSADLDTCDYILV